MLEDGLQDDCSPPRVYNGLMKAQCSGRVKKTDWMSGIPRKGGETSLSLHKPTSPSTPTAGADGALAGKHSAKGNRAGQREMPLHE